MTTASTDPTLLTDMERDEDPRSNHELPFTPKPHPSTSSSSSLSYAPPDVDMAPGGAGSPWLLTATSTVLKFSFNVTKKEGRPGDENQSPEVTGSGSGSGSKTVLMGAEAMDGNLVSGAERDPPLSSSEYPNSSSCFSSNALVRVCADCCTTKTPLWRSGPTGPKSLCNACGIRQRKARRAAAAGNGATLGFPTAGSQSGNCEARPGSLKSRNGGNIRRKRRRGRPASAAVSRVVKRRGTADSGVGRGESSGYYNRVFPQDEREAAILLMALSSGLVRG